MRSEPYDGTGGDNVDMNFRHSTSYTVPGAHCPATFAYFCSVMNWKAGLFMAINNIGPEAKVRLRRQISEDKVGEGTLPLLRHWFDIAFLQWSLLPSMGISLSPLRFVLRANIQNNDTVAVMTHILGFDAKIRHCTPALPQRLKWPGRPFRVDSCAAQVLLGTPNGQGVVYLLAQNKHVLGIKVWSRLRFSLPIVRIGRSRTCCLRL
jgi:hypothetical protein